MTQTSTLWQTRKQESCTKPAGDCCPWWMASCWISTRGHWLAFTLRKTYWRYARFKRLRYEVLSSASSHSKTFFGPEEGRIWCEALTSATFLSPLRCGNKCLSSSEGTFRTGKRQLSFPNTRARVDIADCFDDHHQASNLHLVPRQEVHTRAGESLERLRRRACDRPFLSDGVRMCLRERAAWSLSRRCVCAHIHMPPVFTVIRADDVFKVARQLRDGARANAKGNTSHWDVPVQ